MQALGTLEDLPQSYRDSLQQMNLVPLWPSLRSVLPPAIPSRQTQPTLWKYRGLRPQLMRAGELTPMEKAERRVLVLANPGHGLENMKASPAVATGRVGAKPSAHPECGADGGGGFWCLHHRRWRAMSHGSRRPHPNPNGPLA